MFIDWLGNSEATPEEILGSWKGYGWDENDKYGPKPDNIPNPEDVEIIAAWYEYENYDGSAMVIYRDKRDGKVYEVHGGHCSCYGLEDQWSPEEVVKEELVKRREFVNSWSYYQDEDPAKAKNDAIRAAIQTI